MYIHISDHMTTDLKSGNLSLWCPMKKLKFLSPEYMSMIITEYFILIIQSYLHMSFVSTSL